MQLYLTGASEPGRMGTIGSITHTSVSATGSSRPESPQSRCEPTSRGLEPLQQGSAPGRGSYETPLSSNRALRASQRVARRRADRGLIRTSPVDRAALGMAPGFLVAEPATVSRMGRVPSQDRPRMKKAATATLTVTAHYPEMNRPVKRTLQKFFRPARKGACLPRSQGHGRGEKPR